MNKTIKVISVLLVAIILVVLGSTSVMAAGALIDNMKPTYEDNNGVTNFGQKIINMISTAGVVIAVIVLLVLGIKYMIGSASEKAEYKKTMIPYLVGALLIFGASAIAKVIVSVAQSVTTT